MKRDINLEREILRAVQEEAPFRGSPEIEGYSEAQIVYHIVLLIEAGYVQGSYSQAVGEMHVQNVERLTWEGHEYLDGVLKTLDSE